MKRIFTFISCAIVALSINAQTEGVALLTKSNLDTDNSTNSLYKFTNGWSMTMEARDWTKSQPTAAGWAECLNFKNGAEGIINIPDGLKLYRIDLIGFSQSTAGNWEYLAAWGNGDKTTTIHAGNFEYVAATDGTNDNATIQSFAYPMSATPFLDASIAGAPTPFASIDLTANPYTGTFPVVFYGNNQCDVCFVCYTTEAAAKAGYDMNGGSAAGIKEVKAAISNGAKYNMVGQRINSAKGMFIMNGKKYITK